MMVLILLGITALFGALSFAYIYSRVDKGMNSIKLPALFAFNTLILLASSYFIQQSKKYFDQKEELKVLRNGVFALIATLLFLCLQAIAWHQLLRQQLLPGSSGGHGFLYAISILHFLHVIAGLPFLARIILPLYTAYKNGNASLIMIDEAEKRKLKHTTWYWHFIDVMWIYLVVFFMISGLL